MKRFLIVLGLVLVGNLAQADFYVMETDVTMVNFWQKNGKDVQKIMEIGTRIINANKLDKRVPIQMERTPNVINASSAFFDKTVKISSGLLPYIDNDDELAYILGHEISHSMDSHEGYYKKFAVIANLREYEYKSDLVGIDLMVKAGYNPIAAITCANKWMGESPIDLFFSHPRTSKRLMAMYKYIYVKYPWALKSDMIHNVNYENFTYTSAKEINAFHLKQKIREEKNKSKDAEEL